ADYTAHRTLEHRLQMIGDAQTQTIPSGEDARARVAALSASQDRTAWETGIAARLKRVHASVEAFFVPATPGERAPEPPPDDDSLVNAGFTRPEAARALFERWTSGALPATRSPRARALFAHLQPSLIAKLARGASPDEAIVQFDRFLSGLPAGVQVFSLFCANPHLLDLVVEVSAIAPRLAGHLGRAPGVLDALLDPDFFEPLPEAETLSAELDTVLAPLADYERVLDAARRWAREQKFRAGVQVLRALSDEAEAARAHSAIAEACLVALLPRVEAEFARRHGPPPGRGMAVLALGKLGSREMTGGSDLDLIVIYDAPGDAMSEGRRPLAAAQYYPRLTQALVAAFSAPTAEGRLYEIDMRLRPSGRQGPVATSLAAFSTYQRETAWVWEHLALTRARVVAGAGAKACALGEEVASTVTQALAARRGAVEVIAQASTMRDRLIEAHQRERSTPWALKHTAGGLMEIEFLAQTAILYHGLDRGAGAAGSALLTLEALGWLKASEGQHLNETLVLLRTLQQIERVALERPFDPETTGLGLRQAMARALEVANFDTLEHHLQESTTQAGEIIEHCFQRLGATD
ncbi:MAG: glutamine-synthetase adenylyltransferase, partial [Pseudomonadota bacterium]